jgi:hypothetical protein
LNFPNVDAPYGKLGSRRGMRPRSGRAMFQVILECVDFFQFY